MSIKWKRPCPLYRMLIGKMDKDYTTYSADQLLNDDFFIQSELHPTEKSRAFWSDLQIKSAALSQEIENARLFLHTIKIDRNCSSLAAKDEHALWQRIELKNKETERKAKRKQFIRLAISTVASLLLLSAIGWYATLRPKDAKIDYLAIIQANPAPDSTNEKVQLVLSNNEKLTIDGTETQLEYKKEGKVNVNSKQVDLSPKGNPAQAQEFNQLIVPVGRRSSITFADGTRLWVNSGSKVVYPVKFAKEKREIFVEGEIYLHVSRDEQKPFIVKTHQMDIKVLGTQFNVTAYENEANMQVVLVSGKVEVNLDKCKNVLAPNQMFSYDSKIHKGKITTVDTDNYVAWKDGYYQFHQQPLKEIVKKLSRYYGVRIYCKEPADKLSCSGKLDLKESLDEMMKALKEAAPIQIENKYESIEIKVKH